jgi:exopolysaccharide biosynthesis polyprenyl glycosylphosphotransferase
MLKNHWRIISSLERFADNIIIVATFFLSYFFRDPLLSAFSQFGLGEIHELRSLAPIEQYLVVLGAGLPLFNAILSVLGAYRSMRFSSAFKLFRICVFSSLLVFLCQGSLLYLLKLDLSRSFVAIFCLLSGVFLFIERALVLGLLRFLRLKGRNFRNLLIVGSGPQARELYFEILKQPELGVQVQGFVVIKREELGENEGPSFDHHSSEVYDLPARAVADQHSFEAALKRLAIDEVLFTDIVQDLAQVEVMASIAAEEGVGVTLVADLFSLGIFRSDVSYFGTMPLIHYEHEKGKDAVGLFIKRCLDIAVSGLALLLLSPLLMATALAIKIDTHGPVFFRQRRVGLNGRHFMLLKFRSMIDGAEQMIEVLRGRNEMTGPVFKLKEDPRITRVGRFIRRFSIDELPQLINVLRGDMSLVGPRPPLPEEVSLYQRKQRRRLSMRPGLTCIWQVSGRNDIPSFDEWAKLDLEYIDNWSLAKDFKLLCKTVPAVLSGTGAH